MSCQLFLVSVHNGFCFFSEIQSWDTHPELNSEQIARKIRLAELKTAEEKARNEQSQADAKENLAKYYKLKYDKMKKKSGAESSME